MNKIGPTNLSCNSNIWILANSDGALFRFRNSLIKKLVTKHNVTAYSKISVEGSYQKNLTNLGCTSVNTSFNLSFRAFYTIIRLIYHSYTNPPNAVLIYTLPAIIIFSVVSIFTRKRYVLIGTVTGLGRSFNQNPNVKEFRTRILTMIMKFSFSKYDHIIFQNNDDREFCVENNLLKHKNVSVVAGSGVELDQFVPTHTLQRQKAIRYLYMGRGLRQKGILEFYKVAKELKGKSSSQFLHAGYIDDSLKEEIGDICKYATEHGVHYLGYVQDMPKLLSSVDAVISPSVYREGIPRSLIEALASDKYIITCDTIGNKETVINGYNGAYVDYGNVEQLKMALLEYENKGRDYFKGRSRFIAEKKFDVNIIDNHILKLINA